MQDKQKNALFAAYLGGAFEARGDSMDLASSSLDRWLSEDADRCIRGLRDDTSEDDVLLAYAKRLNVAIVVCPSGRAYPSAESARAVVTPDGWMEPTGDTTSQDSNVMGARASGLQGIVQGRNTLMIRETNGDQLLKIHVLGPPHADEDEVEEPKTVNNPPKRQRVK